MNDFATPNLPARDFDAAEEFYAALGFTRSWRDNGWMILNRGSLMLEFFPYADIDPYSSSFSCCLRLDDLDTLVSDCRSAGIPVANKDFPRLHLPRRESSGITIAYLVDPDGTLLRLIQNES